MRSCGSETFIRYIDSAEVTAGVLGLLLSTFL